MFRLLIERIKQRYRRRREIPLSRGLNDSLLRAQRNFAKKMYVHLRIDKAEFLSRIFTYQCEDLKTAVRRYDGFSDRMKERERMTVMEAKIAFLAYADELIGLRPVTEETVVQKLDEGRMLTSELTFSLDTAFLRAGVHLK